MRSPRNPVRFSPGAGQGASSDTLRSGVRMTSPGQHVSPPPRPSPHPRRKASVSSPAPRAGSQQLHLAWRKGKPGRARWMLALMEAATRRRAVGLGGPIAVAAGAIWASESFLITAIIGNDSSRRSGWAPVTAPPRPRPCHPPASRLLHRRPRVAIWCVASVIMAASWRA